MSAADAISSWPIRPAMTTRRHARAAFVRAGFVIPREQQRTAAGADGGEQDRLQPWSVSASLPAPIVV
jgi:hypothetical protein